MTRHKSRRKAVFMRKCKSLTNILMTKYKIVKKEKKNENS